jgi:S1-C subfamily serine protease
VTDAPLIQALERDGSANPTPRTFSDKLASEASLLWSGVKLGAASEVRKFREDFGKEVLASLAFGTALAVSAARGNAPSKILNFALKGSLAVDLSRRGIETSMAMTSNWSHPERVEADRASVAHALGAGLVDYSVMGLTAFAGMRKVGSLAKDSTSLRNSDFQSAAAPDKVNIPMLGTNLFKAERPIVRTTDKNSELANLYQSQVPSTVKIETSRFDGGQHWLSSGSGFFADSEGLVVTNYHVVQGAKQIEINSSTGELALGQLLARDRKADLAVLKAIGTEPGQTYPAAMLGDSLKVDKATKFYAIGYPDGIDIPVVSEGVGISRVHTRFITGGSSRAIEIDRQHRNYERRIAGLLADASVLPGSSGSGMRDADGKIIGVVSFRLSGTQTGGVSVGHVRAMVDAVKDNQSAGGILDVKTSADASGHVSVVSIRDLSRLDLARRINLRYVSSLVANKEVGTVSSGRSSLLDSKVLLSAALVSSSNFLIDAIGTMGEKSFHELPSSRR